MARAANPTLGVTHLPSIDEEQMRREREENHRLVQRAGEVSQRMKLVASEIRRMDEIYRERLIGNRSKKEKA